MSRLKLLPYPRMAFAITTTVIMLINLSLAVTNNRESVDFEPMFKRAMAQKGGHNQLPSSSTTSFSHAAFSRSTTDSASAGGMHDKWPNGLDGKPKDLKAHQESQRALYERPPGGLPTEPFPYHPHPFISPAPSPSPATSPAPSGNPGKQNRKLLRYTDQGEPKPLQTPPASGPTGSGDSFSSLSPAPAPSPGQRHLDEPYTKGAPAPSIKGGNGRKLSGAGSGKSRLRQKDNRTNKRSLQSYAGEEGRNMFAKRALVPGGGNMFGGGGIGAVGYSGMNAHSTSHTSESGLYGRWPDGSSGRPMHPSERVLFNPYVAPPESQYQIAPPGTPFPKIVHPSSSPSPSPAPSPQYRIAPPGTPFPKFVHPSSSPSPSPSPASAPAPSLSGRRLLSTSRKCRLRAKC